MSSRQSILNKLRQNLPPAMELPSLDEDWLQYPDPLAQFSEVLTGVGGQCVSVSTLTDVQRYLEGLDAYQAAAQRVSAVPGIEATFDFNAVDDPHAVEHVDYAVLPGELAVAENAAVWVDDANVRHRVLFFITQHLALVVPRSGLLHNMHEAYNHVTVMRRPFGAFISGPSKTADIEQSLVIGAHGARSLTVFLVDDLAPNSK